MNIDYFVTLTPELIELGLSAVYDSTLVDKILNTGTEDEANVVASFLMDSELTTIAMLYYECNEDMLLTKMSYVPVKPI